MPPLSAATAHQPLVPHQHHHLRDSYATQRAPQMPKQRVARARLRESLLTVFILTLRAVRNDHKFLHSSEIYRHTTSLTSSPAGSRTPHSAPVFFSLHPSVLCLFPFSPPSQMPLVSGRGNRGTLLRKQTLLCFYCIRRLNITAFVRDVAHGSLKPTGLRKKKEQ